jgi:hypothetical protein
MNAIITMNIVTYHAVFLFARDALGVGLEPLGGEGGAVEHEGIVATLLAM